MSSNSDSGLSLKDDDEQLPRAARQLFKLGQDNYHLIEQIYQHNKALTAKSDEAGFAAQNASISLQKQLDFQRARGYQLSYHLGVLTQEKAQLKQAVAKMPQKQLSSPAVLYEAKDLAKDVADMDHKIAELGAILKAREQVLRNLEDEIAVINGHLASEVGQTVNKRQRCEDLVMLQDRLALARKPQQTAKTQQCVQSADDSTVPLLRQYLAALAPVSRAQDLAAEQLEQRVADLARCNEALVSMSRKAGEAVDFDARLLAELLRHCGKHNFMPAQDVSGLLPSVYSESAALTELLRGTSANTKQACADAVGKTLTVIAALQARIARASANLAEWLGSGNAQSFSRSDSAAGFLADSESALAAFSLELRAAAGRQGHRCEANPSKVGEAEDQRIMDIIQKAPSLAVRR